MSDRDRDSAPLPTGHGREVLEDAELKSWLDHWPAPEAPPSLDARVLAAYRQQIRPAAPQRRWFSGFRPARVAFAGAAGLLLFFSIWVVFRTPHAPGPSEPFAAEAAFYYVEGEATYFLGLNLAGFQPTDDMNVRIIRKESLP